MRGWPRLARVLARACDPQQPARCVIFVTAIANARALFQISDGRSIMASIRTYEGWWDLSLLDEKNERALLSAFVAAIAVWATAFLLELV